MVQMVEIPTMAYDEYLDFKSRTHKARFTGQIPDLWLFTSHKPGAFTYGRSFKDSSLLVTSKQIKASGRALFEIERGGDITYHGPSQIMIYTFIEVPNHDIVRMIRKFEQVIIDVLADFNLQGERKKGYPGVWCNGSKIASIGVAVRKWITTHGISFNLEKDDGGFDMIIPCGIDGITMTSLEEMSGSRINRVDVIKNIVKAIESIFENTLERSELDIRALKIS